jgi:recombination protein RecT
MAQNQASNGPGQGVGWNGDYNAMATKTVLRHLLSKWGYLSIEMMNAFAMDEKEELNAEAIRDEENLEARPVLNAAQAFDNAEEVKEEAAQEQSQEPAEDKPDF